MASSTLLSPAGSHVPASSGKDLPVAVEEHRLSGSPKGVRGLKGNTYRKEMWENYGIMSGVDP